MGRALTSPCPVVWGWAQKFKSYLGSSLRPGLGGEGLWPVWHETFRDRFDLDSFVQDAVLTGALGIGKTYVMVVLLLYRVCLTRCLRNPCRFFRLGRTSVIHFVLLSISKEMVKQTLWPQLLSLMSGSPFFREQCGFNPSKSYSDLNITLKIATPAGPVQLIISGGSKEQHTLGRNVAFLGLDEGNFRLEIDPQNKAYALFASVKSRMVSRFKRLPGFNPGLCVLASSAADESSFTERVIKEFGDNGDTASQLVLRLAIYRAKPNLILASWRFKVVYGSNHESPRVLSGCYDAHGTPIVRPPDCTLPPGDEHEPVPEDLLYELVPGNYADEFLRNPRKALQEFSGISLGGMSRLFPTLVDWNRCIELSQTEGVKNPARVPIIHLSDDNQHRLWDFLVHQSFVCRNGAGCAPLRHPERLRYAHLDLASKSTAGIAICHLAEPIPANPDAGQLPGCRLVVEYDFILAITGGGERHISQTKIEEFFSWLKTRCGFRFGLITADSFQSEYILQRLKNELGILTARQSVDRDNGAYLALRDAVQEHTLRPYRHDRLLAEAAQLIELERKVDHPPGGSKDLADAVAGAHFNAIRSDEGRQLLANLPPGVVGIQAAIVTQAGDNPFGNMVPAYKRKPKEHHV